MDNDLHLKELVDISLNNVDVKNSIDKTFFRQSTLELSPKLLGTLLCRRFDDGTVISAPIVEVEAYTQDDPACHAYKGLTPRTKVMFEGPGRAYVYFIYGMYHCLNIVTEPDGVAGAILIRALAAEGLNGPGKLCREWKIDKSFNGVDLTSVKSPLWLAKGVELSDKKIVASKRIGISQAKDLLWRFTVKDHPSVSTAKKSKARTSSSGKKKGK